MPHCAVANGLLELFEIRGEGLVSAKGAPEVVEEQGRTWLVSLRRAVVNPIALAAIVDQTRSLQIVEMARHVGLRDLQHVLHIAPAQFALQQQVENAQPGPDSQGRLRESA